MKSIKKHLEKALLYDGDMQHALYQYELEELLNEFKSSMAQDQDDYLFAVTEHSGDVAMVLIEKSGIVHINEQARDKLRTLWPLAYEGNMKKLIPAFAMQLSAGDVAVNGVKTVKTP